jgi:hypothetical protein
MIYCDEIKREHTGKREYLRISDSYKQAREVILFVSLLGLGLENKIR